MLELVMRLLPLVLVAAVAFATAPTSVQGQRTAPREGEAVVRPLPLGPVSPVSLAWQRQGEALLASGQPQAAVDALEAAITADPDNRAAYLSLARAAAAQKLYGKAIALYGKVLTEEPNNLSALAGQGEAMVQRGAVERARANLEKLRAICGANCPQATTLAAAIAKGPPATAVAATQPKTPQQN